MHNIYKRPYIVGLVAYLCMLVFAIGFYKERIIFCDASFYLFQILKNNSFAIMHNRFGAAFTEVIPLLLSKAGISLPGIMLGYSASFIIFYCSCYIICGFGLRRYDIALVLFIFNFLFVSDTFFSIDSELPQGIAVMLVSFAFMDNGITIKKGWPFYLILGMLITITGLFHPLIFLPFFYYLGFALLKRQQPAGRLLLTMTGLLFLLILVAKSVLFRDPYDQHSMGGARHMVTLFPNYFNLFSNKHFLQRCITHFYWIPVAVIFIIVFYTRKQKWWRLSLFLCSTIGYLFLINICYPFAVTPDFYIENLYLPLGIFIGIPLVFDILPALREKKAGVIVILLIAGTFFIRIYTTSGIYTRRLIWERKFLTENKDRKLIIQQRRAPLDTLLITWGSPYEFWLLSTTELHKTASVNIVDSSQQYTWMIGNDRKFIAYIVMYDYHELPKKYFIFTDSVSNYTLLK